MWWQQEDWMHVLSVSFFERRLLGFSDAWKVNQNCRFQILCLKVQRKRQMIEWLSWEKYVTKLVSCTVICFSPHKICYCVPSWINQPHSLWDNDTMTVDFLNLFMDCLQPVCRILSDNVCCLWCQCSYTAKKNFADMTCSYLWNFVKKWSCLCCFPCRCSGCSSLVARFSFKQEESL